jgi:photosystem II reaction center protein PsbP
LVLAIFLSTLSIVFVFSALFWLQSNEFSLVQTLYAQPSTTNNKTTLPLPKLESVEPEPSVDSNTTIISEENSTEYLRYEDSDLGFTMNYPANWAIDKDNSGYTVVSFVAAPQNSSSVVIRVIPKGDYESIKEYGDKTFKESQEQTLLAYYRNSSTLLSGKPAMKAIYLSTSNPGLIGGLLGSQSSTSKAMFTATMVPEKDSIYAIAYFAKPNDFRQHLPEVENMINSFKINAKGPIIQEDNSSSTSP